MNAALWAIGGLSAVYGGIFMYITIWAERPTNPRRIDSDPTLF